MTSRDPVDFVRYETDGTKQRVGNQVVVTNSSGQIIDDFGGAGGGGSGPIETQDAGPTWDAGIGVSHASVVSSDAQAGVVVSENPGSGERLVVTDIVVSVDTAMRVDFVEETSGDILIRLYLSENGSAQITPRSELKLNTADRRLSVETSAAGNIAVTAFYYSE